MSKTATSTAQSGLQGLSVERRFSTAGTHPFDEIEWEIRDAVIGNPESPAFEQRGVEFPKSWSQNATNIVAQKYFRGQLGTAEARDLGQADDRPRRRHDRRLGPRGRLLRLRRGRRRLRGRADLDPAQPEGGLQLAGLVQRRLRGAARSARPASSSGSRTTWTRSSPGTPRRARSSAAARARGSTSPTSAARWSSSPRAARPAARSASCAAPTPGPARSSRAARRGARPRWSCSTSTIRTSSTSSGARPTRRRRPRRCATPASTCRSTARASPRSSTRTPTTRCGSPTTSWRRSRPARTGT